MFSSISKKTHRHKILPLNVLHHFWLSIAIYGDTSFWGKCYKKEGLDTYGQNMIFLNFIIIICFQIMYYKGINTSFLQKYLKITKSKSFTQNC